MQPTHSQMIDLSAYCQQVIARNLVDPVVAIDREGTPTHDLASPTLTTDYSVLLEQWPLTLAQCDTLAHTIQDAVVREVMTRTDQWRLERVWVECGEPERNSSQHTTFLATLTHL